MVFLIIFVVSTKAKMTKSKFEVYFSTIIFFVFLTILVFTLNMMLFSYVIDIESIYNADTWIFLSLVFTGIVMVCGLLILRRNYKLDNKLNQVGAFNVLLLVLPLLILLPMTTLFYNHNRLFKRHLSGTEFLEQNFDEILKTSPKPIDSTNLRKTIDAMKDEVYRDWVTNWDGNGDYVFRMPELSNLMDSGTLSIKGGNCKFKRYTLDEGLMTDSNEMYSFQNIELKLDRSRDNVTSFIEWITANWPEYQQMLITKKNFFEFKGQSAIEMQMYRKGDENIQSVNLYFSNSRVFVLKVKTAKSKFPNDKIRKFFSGFDYNPAH